MKYVLNFLIATVILVYYPFRILLLILSIFRHFKKCDGLFTYNDIYIYEILDDYSLCNIRSSS